MDRFLPGERCRHQGRDLSQDMGGERAMNNRVVGRCTLCLTLLLVLSCNGTTEPIPPGVVARQAPGCQLRGAPGLDSCLSYEFHDALTVDFCADGNCCPDSNRFAFTTAFLRDTIQITIADTAAQLCRCTCSYILHVTFTDLPGDEYLFLCRREDYAGQALLYSLRVRRH
jgi:hypothetical protein